MYVILSASACVSRWEGFFSSEKQEADFAEESCMARRAQRGESEKERKKIRGASARFRIRMVIDGIGYYKLQRKSYLSAVKGQVK